MLKKKQKYFFNFFWTRQGLILVLRILIQNEKSGLRSSLEDMFVWKRWYFYILKFIFFWYFWIIWKYVSHDASGRIDTKRERKTIFGIFGK